MNRKPDERANFAAIGAIVLIAIGVLILAGIDVSRNHQSNVAAYTGILGTAIGSLATFLTHKSPGGTSIGTAENVATTDTGAASAGGAGATAQEKNSSAARNVDTKNAQEDGRIESCLTD